MTEQDKAALDRCVDRELYIVASRNLRLAVFLAEHQAFVGIRHKFGERYLDVEIHRGAGGSAIQIERIGACPVEVPHETRRLDACQNKELFAFLDAFPATIQSGSAGGYAGVYQLQRLTKEEGK